MKTLRWIGVLPAAIIGSLIGFYIGQILPAINLGLSGGALLAILASIVGNVLSGFGWTAAGAFVAPDHKKTVAVVLASVGSTLAITSLVVTSIKHGFEWLSLIGILSSVVGAIIGAIYMHEQDDE